MSSTQTTSILSFLWKHIKPYKWYYLLMLQAPLLSSFYVLAYNYAIKLFLDAMVSNQTLTFKIVVFPITLFLVAQLLLELVWRISNIASWKSQPHVRRSILLASYDYVQHHSYAFFQNQFAGNISSKLKGILDGYDKFWSEMHHGLFSRCCKIVVSASALIMVSHILSLFILIWGSALLFIMYSLSKKLNTLALEETESRHTLIGQISDKISNIFTVFSFASRQSELNRLDHQIVTDFMPRQIKLYKYDFKLQIIGAILYLLMYAFILFYMIHLRMLGLVSVGDFAFVLGLVMVLADDIWNVTTSLQDFAKNMGDMKSSMSIINLPHQHEDIPGAKSLVIHNPSIEFVNVCFSYPDNHLTFNQLNLSIKSGEKIGLVGYSGAGKSSMVSLLLSYFQPDSGVINIDQKNIGQVTQDSLRAHIAVIPQDTMLFHRSLRDNIRYGRPDATDEEVMAAAKKAHIHDYIMTLADQYDTHVGERGIKLSGGQRQRISIARAILKDAPILILDEATSSLDSHTEQLIQDSLNVLMEDKNTTVIAIAHRLSTLKHMDRLIVLDKGSIVEQGTHDQLLRMKGSLYRKLWEHQEI
jgi:ATP-binding cassette, subfamily B, bacterial